MSEQKGEPLGEAAEGVEDDAVARRAYELSESDEGGTPEENWLRAERELRGPTEGEDTE